jgi:hypothetical protein
MSFQTISSINYGYTQNLVKNSWLRLRRDINKNLNILGQTCLYFSIWFLDKMLGGIYICNGQFYTTIAFIQKSNAKIKGKIEPRCLNSCLYQVRSPVLTLTKNFKLNFVYI